MAKATKPPVKAPTKAAVKPTLKPAAKGRKPVPDFDPTITIPPPMSRDKPIATKPTMANIGSMKNP